MPPERVFAIAERLRDAGCEEIAFGDTTGMANPAQVRELYGAAFERLAGRRAHRPLPQHPRPGAGQRAGRAGGRRALVRVLLRRAGRLPRARRAPPATWPARTSSRCCTRWATTRASTCEALLDVRARRAGGAGPPARAATCSPPGRWTGTGAEHPADIQGLGRASGLAVAVGAATVLPGFMAGRARAAGPRRPVGGPDRRRRGRVRVLRRRSHRCRARRAFRAAGGGDRVHARQPAGQCRVPAGDRAWRPVARRVAGAPGRCGPGQRGRPAVDQPVHGPAGAAAASGPGVRPQAVGHSRGDPGEWPGAAAGGHSAGLAYRLCDVGRDGAGRCAGAAALRRHRAGGPGGRSRGARHAAARASGGGSGPGQRRAECPQRLSRGIGGGRWHRRGCGGCARGGAAAPPAWRSG